MDAEKETIYRSEPGSRQEEQTHVQAREQEQSNERVRFKEALERHFRIFRKAYDEILARYLARLVAYRRGKAQLSDAEKAYDDLQAAWQDKADAYSRMLSRFSDKRGYSSEEIEAMTQSARRLLQPDTPIPPPPALEEKNDSAAEQVQELMGQVKLWQRNVDALKHAGKLTPDVCNELLGEVAKYDDRLQQVDPNAEASGERRELEALLAELKRELVFSRDFYVGDTQQGSHAPKQEATAVSVTDARAAYQRVVAAYAAVQHTLSIDQRRDMRSQIAQLAGLVRRAELSHVVALATEHAPAVAHASLATSRTTAPQRPPAVTAPAGSRRGLMGVFSDALKLK